MHYKFNYEKRKLLELYIGKSITLGEIARILDVSRATVYTELHKGLSEEDSRAKNWENYSADKAQEQFREQAEKMMEGK